MLNNAQGQKIQGLTRIIYIARIHKKLRKYYVNPLHHSYFITFNEAKKWLDPYFYTCKRNNKGDTSNNDWVFDINIQQM